MLNIDLKGWYVMLLEINVYKYMLLYISDVCRYVWYKVKLVCDIFGLKYVVVWVSNVVNGFLLILL